MSSWPHSPPHWNHEPGIYFVTASTYGRDLIFTGEDRLDLLQTTLLDTLQDCAWRVDGWAIFPNHYHVIARSYPDSRSLSKTLGKLHMLTAKEANLRDQTPGRKIWHNYRETHLTYERSYFARLRYVIQNPVHHGIVFDAEQYRWCSAGWFARTASPAFRKTVEAFPIDRLEIEDNF